jgi:uncharacterized linocin/CFP29 family protein
VIRPVPPHGLSDEVIARIEKRAIDRARAMLTARRFLDFEGPIGPGIESLQVGPVHETRPSGSGATISARRAVPIPTLYASFELPRREIVGVMEPGMPLDTSPAEDAAEEVALAEEHVVYHGLKEIGAEGMLHHRDTQRVRLGDWSAAGGAIGDVIQAADRLDAARVNGPFALVLAPALYNQLFRKYEGSDVLALDHIRRLASAGIYKSHALDGVGVLVSPDLGPIVCAQDVTVTFLDVRESTVRFVVSSAIAVRLDDPSAACVLGPTT